MTFLLNPIHYAQEDFKNLVNSLKWDKGWTPHFPTIHNTGIPDLKTWGRWSPKQQQEWGANLNAYYRKLGWHSGVHLVCCPGYIWDLCDLEHDGISVSCWNHLTIGIEMLGNYEKDYDDWSSGDGLRVKSNAVWVLSVLCNKFGWNPAAYIKGKSGVHFHRECLQDHHACPGSQVDKKDLVERVMTQIRALFNPTMGDPKMTMPEKPVEVYLSEEIAKLKAENATLKQQLEDYRHRMDASKAVSDSDTVQAIQVADDPEDVSLLTSNRVK